MSNQQKGYNYEVQVRDHIRQIKQAYLWSEAPEDYLIDCGASDHK